jgi:tetratricopeptide (TPR) repeat protein
LRFGALRRVKRSAQKKTAPAVEKKAAPPRPPLSSGRKWLFRLGALSLPFLALALVELALRVAGYGYDPAFLKVERGAAGQKYLRNNDRFTLRFFPPELARWPGTFKLAADKPADVQRIFIFGESAAMGDPQPSLGASRYLEVLLREKFPDQKFEIVNLGITAINSHVILPIAQDIAARGQGDLWLIYMGNNEMVGPFGAATVFGSQAPPLRAVRFNLALQKTRVGQLAVAGLRQLGGKPKNASWGGMKMFLENQIPPDDARRETVYQNFERNLRDIVQLGQDSGAKMILSTMAVNLRDCPPFGSLGNSNLAAGDLIAFQARYAGAVALQTNRQCAAATLRFAEAAQLDAKFAELHFRWAQCLLSEANFVAARERFQQACDVDALPFRADTRINGAIRQLAAERAGPNLLLCDAEQALAEAASDGIAGDESFFEHVHFNFAGNYRLGRVWAEQVAMMLPEPFQRAAKADWATAEFCDRAIGLSEWNREFVLTAVLSRMSQPPLALHFNNPERVARLQQELQFWRAQQRQTNVMHQARIQFEAAKARAPEDSFLRENYANFLEAIGDKPAALAEYRAITELMPHDFYGCLQTGRMLGEAGQLEAAREFLERARQHRPSLPEPWFELGVVTAAAGDYAAALKMFERAVALRPQDGVFLAYQAKALSKLNRRAEAIAIYRKAIQSQRGGWEAHFELASELAAAGEVAESLKHYLEVVRLNPQHVVTRINLGVMLVRQNRLVEAGQQFEIALQLEPNSQAARDYLTQVRARQAR